MDSDLRTRLLKCRKHGHDYGQGPGVLPRVDLTKDSEATCQVCGTRREIKGGRLTYHVPPELLMWPDGEVK